MIRSRLSLFLLLAVGTASAGSLHGILPDDINKSGAACTDFFDYANGAWRQQHQIPDDMDRWSRRWQSGELNKEHVRDILTEVSAKHDWPQGSAEQLSGDYFAACMDEGKVNELGTMLPRYYEVRGWNPDGTLKPETRERLGL